MSDADRKPSGFNFWISVIFMVACFLIFALLVDRYYLSSRQPAAVVPTQMSAEQRAESNLLTPEERAARLQDLRAREQAAAGTYEWIDREKGVVRLPIDRAIELTVQKYQSASRAP